MKKRISIIITIIVATALGAYWYAVSWLQTDRQVSCTLEAKLCPDGSAVGRTGPNCEFTECQGVSDENNDQGILPYKSGVRGVVTRGPMCPVMREDMPCPDAPYQTEVYLYRAGSNEVFATAQSNADGTFQFNIPPGDYMIDAKNEGISKTCKPALIFIGSDEMKSVTISCDTGIR